MLAVKYQPYELSLQETDADVLAFSVLEEAREKAARKGVTLHHFLEFGLGILCDQTLLKEAVTKLLDNAIQHSPRGNPVQVQAYGSLTKAIITVQDWGCGIGEEYLAHLFEPFYVVAPDGKSDHNGPGLGLAIARQIVQRHKGQILVESTVGQGSVFAIYLPRYPH